MSAEAPTMSAVTGPAIAPAMGARGGLSSFGPEIGPVSASSFNFDRAVPGNLALNNNYTKIEWQAPQTHNSEPSPLNVIPDITLNAPLAEIMQETPAAIDIPQTIDEAILKPEIANEIIQPDPVLNLSPQTSNFVEETTLPSAISQQEIITDAKQAAKVEETMIATGIAPEEAHQKVLEISTSLKLTGEENQELPEEKKINSLENSKKIFLTYDDAADAERERIATEAVKQAVDSAISEDKQEITGYELYKKMPIAPQPTSVKSEIVKDGNDGSYDALLKEIGSIGKIESDEHAKQIIQNAVSNNHAILKTENFNAVQATEQEVKKVLKSGIIFENKI